MSTFSPSVLPPATAGPDLKTPLFFQYCNVLSAMLGNKSSMLYMCMYETLDRHHTLEAKVCSSNAPAMCQNVRTDDSSALKLAPLKRRGATRSHHRRSPSLPLFVMHNSTLPPLTPPPNILDSIRQSRAYPPHTEATLAAELSRVTTSYPTLHPTTSMFTYPGGSSQSLVALRGTVPVLYRNASYKIPVHIWITPQHPSRPPLVFVVPTRAMVFRKGHPHVDARNGLVYLPYLNEWGGGSNLNECVAAMVSAFSIKPPVYAKVPPVGAKVPPVGAKVPPVSAGPPPGQIKVVNGIQSGISSASQSGEIGKVGVEIGGEERRMLIAKLERRARMTMMEEGGRRIADCKLALETNRRLLEVKKQEVGDGGKEGMYAELGRLESRRDLVKRWLEMHPMVEDESVDEITRYRHVLMEQEVEARAMDMACEDVLRVLDEAVAKGVIGMEEYVLRVRDVSRRMFFERVMVKKVAARKKQLESMARGNAGQGKPPGPGLQERRMSESDAVLNAQMKLPQRRASRA